VRWGSDAAFSRRPDTHRYGGSRRSERLGARLARLERLVAVVVAASSSASAQPRRSSDFRRAHPSAAAKPVSESTVHGECPWRTFFDFLRIAFRSTGDARIRAAVPLIVVAPRFLLLLLFHGNVFLQRDIS
jgi:hypothetical protein